jgi:hypothetical protein
MKSAKKAAALWALVCLNLNGFGNAMAQSTNKPVEKPPAAAQQTRPPRLLVKVKKDTKESDLAAFEKTRNIKTTRNFSQMNGLRVIEVPSGVDPRKLAAEYKESGLVEYAELDQKVHALPAGK